MNDFRSFLSNKKLYIEISLNENEKLLFDLELNHNLFEKETFNRDSQNEILKYLCHFHGIIKDAFNSFAAISLCDGMVQSLI